MRIMKYGTREMYRWRSVKGGSVKQRETDRNSERSKRKEQDSVELFVSEPKGSSCSITL